MVFPRELQYRAVDGIQFISSIYCKLSVTQQRKEELRIMRGDLTGLENAIHNLELTCMLSENLKRYFRKGEPNEQELIIFYADYRKIAHQINEALKVQMKELHAFYEEIEDDKLREIGFITYYLQ